MSQAELPLNGSVAVITGAGGGLGRGLTEAFARAGAAVVCQDLREDAAQACADAIATLGPSEPMVWACDVTDSAAVEAMFDEAWSRYGVVDVLVNNAGVQSTPGDGSPDLVGLPQLAAMTDGAWSMMIDVHLTGAFYCSRAMVRRLLEAQRGGSITSIGSIVAMGGVGPIHYAAAKGGIIALMRAIAQSGGRHGIRANTICPGMISTPMTDALPADQEYVRKRTPLGRIGQPSDIAALSVFLAGEGSFITSQTLSPNGGYIST